VEEQLEGLLLRQILSDPLVNKVILLLLLGLKLSLHLSQLLVCHVEHLLILLRLQQVALAVHEQLGVDAYEVADVLR